MLDKPRYVLTPVANATEVHTDKGKFIITEEWPNKPFYRDSGEDSSTLSRSGEHDAEPDRLEWEDYPYDSLKELERLADDSQESYYDRLITLALAPKTFNVTLKVSRTPDRAPEVVLDPDSLPDLSNIVTGTV